MKKIGWLCIVLFLASIPFANWWLDQHGFWVLRVLGPIPSAVWVVGIAFILRDMGQLAAGRMVAWIAIGLGVGLSVWLASPALALASGVAFAWSESTDALVFTPLASRGTTQMFAAGLFLSGMAASVVDSALFVRIAFGTFDGWWQLTLAKCGFVLLAGLVGLRVRRRFGVIR